MVSVIIISYNHEKFIRDAIESAINQKTDFRYEILIHDDASTDGTIDIIKQYEKKYPNLIRAVIETENQFQKGRFNQVLFDLKRAGKYFAYLEGDDYWTDEEKLQKQIDFLETHKEYSMCIHNAVQLNYMTGEKRLLNTFPEEGTYSQEEQVLAGLGTDFPATASYVMRTSYLKDMPAFFRETSIGDYPYRQYYANCGKIYYFEKAMSVYRTAVPDSYMSNVRSDKRFYNKYTLQMIVFYEKLDKYTEHKFTHILEKKIISDYLGFCASVGEKEGLEMAAGYSLNMDKIKKCYKCISETYLNNEIKELCERSGNVYIYGISRIGSVCSRQMDYAGFTYEGFVVSDGQVKPKQTEGKPVYYLSEVVRKAENPGFILAVQPINENVIIEKLQEFNITNYCRPYALESISLWNVEV